ncbi:MAG: cytochrome c oxidase subunit II [Pirellulales bacterium]|nr:cytochrome c oxidase subunit II [Pirellulales bacterium]
MIDLDGLYSLAELPLLAQTGGSFWLPDAATKDPAMDPVFYLILAVCALFFFLVVGLMGLFVVRYARRPGVKPQKTTTHHTLLEIVWSVIPLIIVGVIFYQGFAAYMEMQNAPSGCYEIRVTGRQWQWVFTYPNGYSDDNLHVPVDLPVKLTMTSTDVIHSLWIPALRVKMDLVPGRYTSVWFRADKEGTYRLLCTEYCGDEHSNMLAAVVVHSAEDFQEWLKGAADYLTTLPPAEAGKILYQRRGCFQCHSTDGTAGTGPSLLGIYGRTHTLADGGTVVVDDNYIRQSILEPQAKILAGYQPVMSTYQGLVTDDEITTLIEFIKTLK